MVHFEESYKIGKNGEDIILPKIKVHFNRDIKQYPNKYSKYDYFDNKYLYEVKTRTNTLNRYDTTIITENKLMENRVNKPVILLFNFTDCIASIEYNKDKFESYEREMFSRAQIKDDEKIHVHIPIEDLTVIYRKEKQIFPSYQKHVYLFSDA
jgi:hypothetical protein